METTRRTSRTSTSPPYIFLPTNPTTDSNPKPSSTSHNLQPKASQIPQKMPFSIKRSRFHHAQEDPENEKEVNAPPAPSPNVLFAKTLKENLRSDLSRHPDVYAPTPNTNTVKQKAPTQAQAQNQFAQPAPAPVFLKKGITLPYKKCRECEFYDWKCTVTGRMKKCTPCWKKARECIWDW
jgi:hypothetical protein